MNLVKNSESITISSSSNEHIVSSNFPDNSKYIFRIPLIRLSSDDILYTKCQLSHFEFVNTMYNVHKNNNNLIIETASSTIVVVVPPANYTALSLITTILADQYIPTGFDITFEESTSKFVFSSDGPFTITKDSTINDVLGNKEYQDLASGFQNKLTMPYPVNLLGTRSISISIDEINTNNYDSALQKSILKNVQLGAQFGEIQFYEQQSNSDEFIISGHINQLTVSILDDNGNLIENNGQHFSLTLRFDKYYFMNTKIIRKIVENPNEEEDVQIDNNKPNKKK